MRLFRIPSFIPNILKNRIWRIKNTENKVYLTFDDGPSPELTPFILETLEKSNIKATFFCVGENVAKYPELFQRIKNEGHQIGNHSYNHKSYTKISKKEYLDSIEKANELIQSEFYRPPYGRISLNLARIISKKYKLVMWSWISYDFDENVSIEKIIKKADKQIKSGEVLVLHDNPKITEKQKELLPKLIELLKSKGFSFVEIGKE